MENLIQEYTSKLKTLSRNSDDFVYTSRKLIQAHIKENNISEAKNLLRQCFAFNRKDLLTSIMHICKREDSPSFAEELIGNNIRCYSYVWLDFCVDLQKLYIESGESQKADLLAKSVYEVAFTSIKPAMSALHKCITQSGNIVLGSNAKRLYKELKQIEQEL